MKTSLFYSLPPMNRLFRFYVFERRQRFEAFGHVEMKKDKEEDEDDTTRQARVEDRSPSY